MLAVYLVMVTTVGLVLGRLNLPTYWELLHLGRSADAVVLRTNCDNHASVFYKFEADGRQYEDFGSAGYGTPDCDEIKAGDPIVIHYLPSRPHINVPGDIKQRWANELAFLGLAVTVMPAIFVYVVWRHLPPRYRHPSAVNR